MAEKTLVLTLDEDLDAALEKICTERGQTKNELISDLLRQFVASEQFRLRLLNPQIVEQYQTLAEEDIALAEEGMAEYQQLLKETDEL